MTLRVLVTGGAGFMGSNFVRHLLAKYPDYQVTVLDALTYAGNLDNLPLNCRMDGRLAFWRGDVCNSQIVDILISESDVVVHFAAETHVARSIYDNRIFFQTDVLGTQAVANAVLKSHVERFIHISTSEVYGTCVSSPMTEEHPLNPRSPYASAKAGADRLVYSYHTTYGIPCIILRPFNNYGPNQHLEKVIPNFITSALRDEPLAIHGSGRASRDWVFVEDACEAFDLAMHADLEKLKGEAINIGSGRDIDVLTIARAVLGRLGKPDDLITLTQDRPGQVSRHISSTQKAKELLGWEAKTRFEDGLDATIRWYRENQDWWEKLIWLRDVPIYAGVNSRITDRGLN